MSIFDAKESRQGSVVSFPVKATTVDIGISVAGMAGVREQHSGIMVVSDRLASAADIDRAIDRIMTELNEVRAKGKSLLASLKGS